MVVHRDNQSKRQTPNIILNVVNILHKILFDTNNLAMRLLHLPMIEAEKSPKWDFWKYMLFNNIYEFTQHLFNVDGIEAEVILACDSKEDYWRREIYPPYKADRKKDSAIDWAAVYAHYNDFLEDLNRFTPWKVITVPRAEADDIIAVLCKHSQDPCIVHSGDSDYLQLVSDKVQVYMPQRGDYVTFPCEVKVANKKVLVGSKEEYLDLCILTGQGGKDNVYNVKTPTDWEAVPGKKKPGFGVVAAQKILKEGLTTSLQKLGFEDTYQRNKVLISFDEIPEDIHQAVLEGYSATTSEHPNMNELLHKYYWPSFVPEIEDVELLIAAAAGLEIDTEDITERATETPQEVQNKYDFVL